MRRGLVDKLPELGGLGNMSRHGVSVVQGGLHPLTLLPN